MNTQINADICKSMKIFADITLFTTVINLNTLPSIKKKTFVKLCTLFVVCNNCWKIFLIRIWYDRWSLSRTDITLFATVMIFNTYSTEWNPHWPEYIYQEIKRCNFLWWNTAKDNETMLPSLKERNWSSRQMLILWKHRHVEKVFSPDWLHFEKRWDLTTMRLHTSYLSFFLHMHNFWINFSSHKSVYIATI